MPALKPGSNGRLAGQPLMPNGPSAANGDGVGVPPTTSPPGVVAPTLHGVSVAEASRPVVQTCELTSGARGPILSFRVSFSNGSWGLFRNVVVTRPSLWSTDAEPGIFTITPDPSASMYIFTSWPSSTWVPSHGEHAGSPRNTRPSSGFSSSCETIVTLPTCEASGHPPGAVEERSICSAVQATSPFAEDGERVTPSGSATVASRSWGLASSVGVSCCLSCSWKVYPEGDSGGVVVVGPWASFSSASCSVAAGGRGRKEMAGSNFSASQPVTRGEVYWASFQFGSGSRGCPSGSDAPGCSQLSASALVTGARLASAAPGSSASASTAQSAGLVRNGASGPAGSAPRSNRFLKRSGVWEGFAGSPHRVSWTPHTS